MRPVHSLLKRQLKRHLNVEDPGALPPEWRPFLESINEAYHQSDADRVMIERSMELSSQELLSINALTKERERRLRTLLENVSLVAVGLDKDGRVEYANPFYLKLTGFSEADVLGQPWFDRFVVGGTGGQTHQAFRRIMESEFFPQYENVILRKDGEERRISWNTTLLRDEKGDIIGTLSIGEDITDKLKLQQQMIDNEKARTIAQLAGGVAHEVKNPLAVLLQGLEYFIRQIDFGDNKIIPAILKDMQHAVLRADSIIKGLLDLSRPPQMSLKPENINPILENSYLLLKNNFDRRHIRLEWKLDPALPMVVVDKEKLLQVFINLFNNASEAMSQGGGVITVCTSTVKSEGGHCVVTVIEDTGSGIPPDVMSRIFDPFFTTKRGQGGTGLGLPIVKNIMQLHGGTIEIRNRKEGGAHVRLEFPVRKINQMAMGFAEQG